MKKIYLYLIFFYIFTFTFLINPDNSFGETVLYENQTAVVTNVKGTVALQCQGGAWEYVNSKRTVAGGTQICTYKDSCAKITFPDGTDFRLFENSSLIITVMKKSDNVSNSLFNVVYGKLKAVVQTLTGNSTFEVQTPNAVASIRGTDFEIYVDKNDKEETETKLNVVEGIVDIASISTGTTGTFEKIIAGTSAIVSINGNIDRFNYLLPLVNENEMKFWIEYKINENSPIYIPIPW